MYVYLNGEAVSENMPITALTICLAVGSIITEKEFNYRCQEKWVGNSRSMLKLNLRTVEENAKRIRDEQL